jgi:hypothetical protein
MDNAQKQFLLIYHHHKNLDHTFKTIKLILIEDLNKRVIKEVQIGKYLV